MSSLFARSFALVVIGLGSALAASSLQAQVGTAMSPDSLAVTAVAVTQPSRGTNVDSLSAGPRIVSAGIALPRVVRSSPELAQGSSSAHVGAGSNVALMGVGAAGIIIGSLVGGDGGTAISIGGGVIGLYGLFRYLR